MTPLRMLHAPGSNMQPGRGERREDCARHDDCLDGWVRTGTRHGLDPEAHCDPRCPTFEPRSTRPRLDHEATRRIA